MRLEKVDKEEETDEDSKSTYKILFKNQKNDNLVTCYISQEGSIQTYLAHQEDFGLAEMVKLLELCQQSGLFLFA